MINGSPVRYALYKRIVIQLNVVFSANEDEFPTPKSRGLEKGKKNKCSRNQTDEQKSVPFCVPS
jgi:hypothetical protein